MNYNEFKTYYLGKFIDYDHNKQYRCTDPIKQILDQCYCLGPIGSLGNAEDYIRSIPERYPQFKLVSGIQGLHPGDIIIRTKGDLGHVAIFDSIDSFGNIVVLEQNGVGGADIKPGNEIRLKAYNSAFFQCYLTDKIKDESKLLEELTALIAKYTSR